MHGAKNIKMYYTQTRVAGFQQADHLTRSKPTLCLCLVGTAKLRLMSQRNYTAVFTV
jgi:hypothetical protein